MKSLEERIKALVSERSGDNELAKVMSYIMFPAGKLFRPLLAVTLARDKERLTDDHFLLAAALEAHHAYSLAHDDLPCMDDDIERRGRPCAHIRFNEWKALLAGDALINLSYELLAAMESDKAKDIILEFSQMMGSQGLIYGQFIDLAESKKSWKQTLEMHRLKTGRLIQFALTASLDLCASPGKEEISKLGELMGVNFQLLDDLGELAQNVDQREKSVNAFLNFNGEEVFRYVKDKNSEIRKTLDEQRLTGLKNLYDTFLQKTAGLIENSVQEVSRQSGVAPSLLKELYS